MGFAHLEENVEVEQRKIGVEESGGIDGVAWLSGPGGQGEGEGE